MFTLLGESRLNQKCNPVRSVNAAILELLKFLIARLRLINAEYL